MESLRGRLPGQPHIITIGNGHTRSLVSPRPKVRTHNQSNSNTCGRKPMKRGIASSVFFAILIPRFLSSGLGIGGVEALTPRDSQPPGGLGLGGRLCQRDSDCPGDQECSSDLAVSNRISASQNLAWCVCPKGYIVWKWSCYPQVQGLGSRCLYSVQCSEGQICDPLKKTCTCTFGFVPRADQTACTMASHAEDEEASHKLAVIKHVINHVNTSFHTEKVNKTPMMVGDHPPHTAVLNPDQIHTVLYIGLALLCVFCLGAISAIYMKTMKDKRRNQAAIRGLLDIVGGGGDSSSVVGSSSLGSFDTNTGGIYPNSYVIQPPTPGNGYIHSVDSSIINLDTSLRRQSKILLPALDEDHPVTLPAPHLSMPILPPIRAKQRQHKGEDIRYLVPRPRVDGEIETPTIASITESLNEINKRSFVHQNGLVESAASFPVETGPILE